MSTVSQDDAHALRRKVEDLSRQHEQIVSGLTGEVDRLHNVCHGLMLQLVMNGLSPSVPSGARAERLKQLASPSRTLLAAPDAPHERTDDRSTTTPSRRP